MLYLFFLYLILHNSLLNFRVGGVGGGFQRGSVMEGVWGPVVTCFSQ